MVKEQTPYLKGANPPTGELFVVYVAKLEKMSLT